MLPFIKKNHQWLFYIAWCLINIIQAASTELFDDEAYYWVYAQFPAWGYFDHPPVIALLIKAGYAIFPNELGVRIFPVLLNTATIFIVQQLLSKKDDLLFYAIAGSIALVQIGGVLAVPDIPLLFFVALFFWLYRRFLHQMSVVNAVLLGLGIAAMLYSKYHGILIVLCTLLSNVRLFTRYQTYIVALIALVALGPHLYWQYAHGFPSVQFHLFERNTSSYHPKYTLEYLAGQIVLAGPLMGWLLLKSAFAEKPASLTERALRFSLIGLYGFFLLNTFRGRVEANWTAPAFIALIVLSHQHLLSHPRLRTWLYKALPFSLGFVLLLRIYMLPFMPTLKWVPKDEFHQNKEWVGEIRERAQGLPVVFKGTYQRASKYWFYAHSPSLSMNSIDYRRNNYNFWPLEDSLLGKPALVVDVYDSLFFTHRLSTLDNTASKVFSPYYSFSKVNVKFKGQLLPDQEQLVITGTIQSPEHYLPFFQQTPYDTVRVQLAFEDAKEKVQLIKTSMTLQQVHSAQQPFRVWVPVSELPPGHYTCRFAINSCIPGAPSMNSTGMKLLLK